MDQRIIGKFIAERKCWAKNQALQKAIFCFFIPFVFRSYQVCADAL